MLSGSTHARPNDIIRGVDSVSVTLKLIVCFYVATAEHYYVRGDIISKGRLFNKTREMAKTDN